MQYLGLTTYPYHLPPPQKKDFKKSFFFFEGVGTGSHLYHSVAHKSGDLYYIQTTSAVSDGTPAQVTLNFMYILRKQKHTKKKNTLTSNVPNS